MRDQPTVTRLFFTLYIDKQASWLLASI
jgi:hypothetical protein